MDAAATPRKGPRGEERIDETLFTDTDPLPLAGAAPGYESPSREIGERNELFYARVDLLFESLPMALAADFIVAFFVVIVSSVLEPRLNIPLLLWVISIQTITSLRYFILLQYRRTEGLGTDYESRYQYLILGSLATGLCWGLLPMTVAPTSTPSLIILVTLWLAGMLTGAASMLSAMRMIFAAFTVPLSLVYIASILLYHDSNRLELIASYLLFLGFLVPIALRTRADTGRHIAAVLENRHMQATLATKAKDLEEKEEELQAQRSRQAMLEAQKARADAKLRSAAEDKNLLLNALQEGIFGISEIGAITFINKSALSMLEYSEEEVIGMSAPLLLNPIGFRAAASSIHNEAIVRTYREGIPLELVDSAFRKKSNTLLHVRYSAEPVVEKGAVCGAVVNFIDLSKQKEMENMLMQSQKMEAIGRLTGGVAHDFNNLLTVILGNLQFLERRIPDNESALALVKKIVAAAQSGAELNNRLLSFSREQSLRTTNVDVGAKLVEMKEFFARMLGASITLVCTPSDEECIAATDAAQLENAILNLCINARDAMPNGGTVTLSSRLVDRPASIPVPVPAEPEHRFVELEIQDDGMGMSAEVKDKIFEPFFTTKSKGRGTGLGLSTVFGFVTQSGGTLTVESEVGVGTTFRLTLPPGRPDLQEEQPETTLPLAVEAHSGTVLVVEDNDSVREVAVQMLRSVGYRVIEASDGSLGLLKFDAHPEIDCVFSDIIMPGGINGIEMAEKILQIRPSTPILLATGFIEKELRARIHGHPKIRCIPKPYNTNEIPHLIAKMRDESASGAEEAPGLD